MCRIRKCQKFCYGTKLDELESVNYLESVSNYVYHDIQSCLQFIVFICCRERDRFSVLWPARARCFPRLLADEALRSAWCMGKRLTSAVDRNKLRLYISTSRHRSFLRSGGGVSRSPVYTSTMPSWVPVLQFPSPLITGNSTRWGTWGLVSTAFTSFRVIPPLLQLRTKLIILWCVFLMRHKIV